MDTTERFMAKVHKTDSGCWEWTAERHRDGYGKFWLDGKKRFAHRVSFEWENGPIPDGLVVDHLCRNPPCVNPDHLRAVTQRENLLSGETIVAVAAQRITCPNGHPYDETNTRIDGRGFRQCKECRWETDRRKAERAALARPEKSPVARRERTTCPHCGGDFSKPNISAHIRRKHAREGA